MRTTIIGFILLQIVVWSIVFSDESGSVSQSFYDDLSDTWEVVNVNYESRGDVILHFPTFDKLTLNSDGTYIRLKRNNKTNDRTREEGAWSINDEQTHLLLDTGFEVEKYEIIQLPSKNSQVFVIKEYLNKDKESKEYEYKLTRM